jgi:hypothetical protein
MSYFESDIVKKEFEDLFKLEDELISKMMSSKLDTKEEIAELRELITKQKIVYTRLSLSDDPEAKKYKKNFDIGVSCIFPENDSVMNIYNSMEDYLEELEQSL